MDYLYKGEHYISEMQLESHSHEIKAVQVHKSVTTQGCLTKAAVKAGSASIVLSHILAFVAQ